MIREISVRTVPLTVDLALEFATMKAWDGERPLKRARVEWLRRIYDIGDFKTPSWAFAWYRGERIRINGQHSSVMLSEIPAISLGRQVLVEEWAVDSVEDLGNLFTRYDAPGCVRNATDVTKALTTELKEIDVKIRRSISSGMYTEEQDFVQPKRGKDAATRASALHMDHAFARWAAEQMGPRHVQRVGCYAAAFRMWKRDAEACKKFWGLVASEADPDPSSGTRTLARQLRDAKVAGSKGGRDGVVRTASICIGGWNAWRAGRRVQYLKHMGAGVAKAA